MSTLNNSIRTLAVIIFLFSSCQRKAEAVIPEYLSTKEIPDWNEIYPLLLPSALKWDPDARLDMAVVEINWQNQTEQRFVSAFFQTPNKKFETLHLRYLKDGTIKANVNPHKVAVTNFDFIENTEWKLNSVEAWNLFLQNPDVVSQDQKLFDCSTLILINKTIGNAEKKVVWQLSLADCEYTMLIQYFIDAISGDLLGVETH